MAWVCIILKSSFDLIFFFLLGLCHIHGAGCFLKVGRQCQVVFGSSLLTICPDFSLKINLFPLPTKYQGCFDPGGWFLIWSDHSHFYPCFCRLIGFSHSRDVKGGGLQASAKGAYCFGICLNVF